MRASALLLAAAVQAFFVTDVNATRRDEPGLKQTSFCNSTDDLTQCLALVDLYTATNGHKWKNNNGWLSGSSYCGWPGVTCDSSGNVIDL